jgi:hypothetical protein
VLHAKGSDKHPMTREEALQKFRLLASRVLSRTRVEQLEDTVLNLEKLQDARKIAKLLNTAKDGGKGTISPKPSSVEAKTTVQK